MRIANQNHFVPCQDKLNVNCAIVVVVIVVRFPNPNAGLELVLQKTCARLFELFREKPGPPPVRTFEILSRQFQGDSVWLPQTHQDSSSNSRSNNLEHA